MADWFTSLPLTVSPAPVVTAMDALAVTCWANPSSVAPSPLTVTLPPLTLARVPPARLALRPSPPSCTMLPSAMTEPPVLSTADSTSKVPPWAMSSPVFVMLPPVQRRSVDAVATTAPPLSLTKVSAPAPRSP